MEPTDFLSRYVEPYEEGLQERTLVRINIGKENYDIPRIEEIVEAQKNELPRWRKGFILRNDTIFFLSKYYVPRFNEEENYYCGLDN